MRPLFNVALIIPTGVGAAIGGYGGDAMTLLPLFASVCDTLITHPNVANAAAFQRLPENTLYVEGTALDGFFRDAWRLQPVRANRVGILWDAGIPAEMETLHRNTVAAVETVYGVAIQGWETTHEPVQLTLETNASGRSAGCLDNPATLLRAAERLIAQGVSALAVCCLMPTAPDDATLASYQSGKGVDPIGGLEAMISHFLVDTFNLPVAHAPVFTWEEAHPVLDRPIDAKSAAEFITATFLPCVLTGLARAPQLATQATATTLHVSDMSAVVVPADALGSVPVLIAAERGIPILAVRNNATVMACDSSVLGFAPHQVTHCETYLDAVGHLVALKAGLQVPTHIRTPLAATQPIAP